MTRIFKDFADLQSAVGQTLGPSEALAVSQDSINLFANATHDHQWIHTDVERATREAGGTIAHGMLTLSLVVPLVTQLFRVDAPVSINYGFDRVRFITPLTSGECVCATARIQQVQATSTGVKVMSEVAITDQQREATYCIADWWTYYPKIMDGVETNE